MSESARSVRRLGVEFFVIILGVLIALAVDRAVQGVDEGALERSYLESLLVDFQRGAQDMEYQAGFILERMSMIEALIRTVETGAVQDSMTAEDLARAIELAGWHPPVTFPRVTWEDLINTGRLALIANPEVRSAVAEFYVGLGWLQDLDANWRQWMAPMQSESDHHLSPQQRLAITRGVFGPSQPPIDPPPLADLVASLAERPETLRNLGQALIVAELAGNSVANAAADARNVVALLEAELSR